MRMRAPTTPSCCGVEPAFHLDMLSADELAGQGVSLLPAATPPSVNQGLVLNGTTQYARARNQLVLPQLITLYVEFLPTFAYNANNTYTLTDGDGVSTRIAVLKLDNANLNRIYLLIGGGSIYVDGAVYGAGWLQNQRNKLVFVCLSGAGAFFLNGVQYGASNVAFTTPNPTYFHYGITYAGTAPYPGTIYDVRIYTRLLTAAEAIQLTTLT